MNFRAWWGLWEQEWGDLDSTTRFAYDSVSEDKLYLLSRSIFFSNLTSYEWDYSIQWFPTWKPLSGTRDSLSIWKILIKKQNKITYHTPTYTHTEKYELRVKWIRILNVNFFFILIRIKLLSGTTLSILRRPENLLMTSWEFIDQESRPVAFTNVADQRSQTEKQQQNSLF